MTIKARHTLIIIAAIAMSAQPAPAQDDFVGDFLKDALKEQAEFKEQALKEHAEFRDKILNELSEWASQKWEPKALDKPQVKPHDNKPVPPVVVPRGEDDPVPVPEPVVIRPVVVKPAPPKPEPPKPVIPVSPKPSPAPLATDFAFKCYGTDFTVKTTPTLKSSLYRVNFSDAGTSLASAFKVVDRDAFETLLNSLRSEAQSHNFSDWSMLKLTEKFVQAYLPGDANLQEVLQAMLLISCGYDIRMASSGGNGRVYMLVGMKERLVGQYRWQFDGVSYYPLETTPHNMYVMPKSYPGTRPMSAQPSGAEIFAPRPGEVHDVKVCLHHPHCYNNNCKNPSAHFPLTSNLNRMDFYTDCPQYIEPGEEYSYWNTYCGAELSQEMKNQLYPGLKSLLGGKSKLEQVNVLMKFVEAFPYGYDDQIWGGDRAFFAEETLHYPKRDCEDGAILLTRVVRDLVGLPTALIYYPGHLAAAVAFDTPVSGAYIDMNGRRYTICDPTYYYVDAGVQMPANKVNPAEAVLIPVRN